ncbi:MAG: 2-amino-4-hydroxy-6-hydroxymethyldihydropteridine diphosphokinase [Kordiimonadaceae bacterium]|nr:2-amino-4-hydroxy-6-hydroxymethyldihydropteridine diphosphokinase [Kordiimonadaceae bacterium]
MILIGLGSNLTTDEYKSSSEILDAAINELKVNGVQILNKSSYYETEPVPKSDQPWYVNAVISVETSLSAPELLKLMHEIELNLGRVRRDRWEARIIDLDLLCYHDKIYPNKNKWLEFAFKNTYEEMVIPHPRMHLRDFVLIPANEIAGDWVHPVFNKNIITMLNEQDSDGIVRLL